MPLEQITAWVMLAALVTYVLLGGADFGGGVWDLLSWGPRASRQRGAIHDAIGPIWEANHVWLIIVIVLLFTGFPRAFAAIMTALHVPLAIMLVGIVWRGSAFTFRTYDKPGAAERRWGLFFSISSLLTPLLLGVTMAALASGDLRWDEQGVYRSGFFKPWLSPFCWCVGVLALALFACLAAVYLCVEVEDDALREDFRGRAFGAAIIVMLAAGICRWLAIAGAPVIHQEFMAAWWGWLVQAGALACAIAGLWCLWVRRFALARLLVITQAVLIVGGFGMALFPYLVVPQFTLENSAAPHITHRILLISLAVGGVVLLPSFIYLFRVFKGERAFALIDREMLISRSEESR